MRNPLITYFRVVAMFMVVFYHCLCFYGMWPDSPIVIPFYQSIGKFVHSIDMPTFMFISGSLYATALFHSDKYNSTGRFLKNKMKRLIIPYTLWGGVINSLFSGRYSVSQLLYGISHLWFLLALMMIFTIAHLSRRYWMGLSIKGMLGLIALFFMISPLVSKSGIALLALPATAYYLPAFFSGIFCSKYIDKLKELVVKNRKLIKISTFALVSAQLFICFSLIPSSIQSQLTKLFSLLIIASLWMLCFDKKWNTPSAIHSLDVNSMGIYIIHHILLIFLITNDTTARLMTEYWHLSPLLLFIFVSLVSWILAALINRSRYSKFIFG